MGDGFKVSYLAFSLCFVGALGVKLGNYVWDNYILKVNAKNVK
jgi:hypothetical protein